MLSKTAMKTLCFFFEKPVKEIDRREWALLKCPVIGELVIRGDRLNHHNKAIKNLTNFNLNIYKTVKRFLENFLSLWFAQKF